MKNWVLTLLVLNMGMSLFAGCARPLRVKEEAPPTAPVAGKVVDVEPSPLQLTRGDYDNGFASFHPSGNLIVYTSHRTGSPTLYTLHLETGEEKALEGVGEADLPFWSTDGAGVIFSRPRGPGEDEFQRDICFYDVEEGIVATIVSDEGDDWLGKPVDEVRFLYLKDKEGDRSKPFWERGYALWWGYLDGRPSTPLPVNLTSIISPLLTPEGRLLACDREGKLWWVDTVSGEAVNQVPLGDIQVREFDLHPNGNWLLLTGTMEGKTYGLYLYDLPTQTLQLLLTSQSPIRSPQFSPQGDRFIFAQEVEGYIQLFLWRLAQ